jgi:hypothetical protein
MTINLNQTPAQIVEDLLERAASAPAGARVIKWFAFDGQWQYALLRADLERLFGEDAVKAALKSKALRAVRGALALVEVNFEN